jgi:chromosome segregation ATPase
MTSDSPLRAGMHPSIVLSAYIEPLYRGRRVAVLGDATIGLAAELAERGARLVHAYDPDPARAAEALAKLSAGRTHQVAYAVLAADLGVRDGAFDVVVVPDLSIFGDPAEILRQCRRLVSPAGAVVVAVPNARPGGRRLLPESSPSASRGSAPPGYYELYDLVSLQFAKVRMIGQAPFVGYTVADFAPGSDPEVSVDTSLLTSSEEPEHFIAVASERPVVLEPYTVVELPWAEVASAHAGPSDEARDLAEKAEEDRLALTEARTRLSLVTAELEKVRDREADGAREAEQKATATAALSARVVELGLEVEAREGRIRELEGRAGDNHVRAERLANQIRDLEEELRRQRDRGTRLSKQLDDEKKARTKADLELGMIRGLSSPAPPMPSEPAAASTPRPTTPAAPDPSIELGRELAAERDRARAVAAELAEARARISELEQDQAETRRRVQLPKPSATEASGIPMPDAKLIHRLNELESAVNASLREAADASSARDAALERARKGEARAQRMLELEAALLTAESARNELGEQVRVLEAQLAETGPRQKDAERRIADASRRAAERDGQLAEARTRIAELELRLTEARSRTIDLERRLGDIGNRPAELERALADSRALQADLEARLADAERRPADLEARLAEAEKRVAEIADARAAAEAATAEIAALEAALGARGRAVSDLQKDLRESDRIGRELLDEMIAARAPNGVSHASATSAVEVEDLRAQLDRLAQSAARGEADLQAAGWRITQLERELRDVIAEPRGSDTVQEELSAALAAARDEVATLRRALSAQQA